jgi:hypothetical protein
MIGRRALICKLGRLGLSGAATCLLAGCNFMRGREPTAATIRRVGFLSGAPRDGSVAYLGAFEDELRKLG